MTYFLFHVLELSYLSFFSAFCISNIIVKLGVVRISINKLFVTKL